MNSRRILLVSLCSIVLVICLATISYAESNVLDEAIEKATEQQKPILIEFVHSD